MPYPSQQASSLSTTYSLKLVLESQRITLDRYDQSINDNKEIILVYLGNSAIELSANQIGSSFGRDLQSIKQASKNHLSRKRMLFHLTRV